MEGYAKLAQLMGTFDDFAIFRSFKALNYQNLLYLQAEIIHLDEELRELAQRDASHPGREYHAKSWWSLSNGDDMEDQEQWEKACNSYHFMSRSMHHPMLTVVQVGPRNPRETRDLQCVIHEPRRLLPSPMSEEL